MMLGETLLSEPSRFLLEYPAKTPLIPLSRISTSNSHILGCALRLTRTRKLVYKLYYTSLVPSCPTRPRTPVPLAHHAARVGGAARVGTRLNLVLIILLLLLYLTRKTT